MTTVPTATPVTLVPATMVWVLAALGVALGILAVTVAIRLWSA